MDLISADLVRVQNRIPIAMATDENYVLPTVVAMTSALENAEKNTFYEFYLLVPADFSPRISRNIAVIKDKYPHCEINLIEMEERFDDVLMRIDHITKPTCYRLLLGEILLQHEKCIYIDSDVIVCTDLTELFSTDIEGCYLGGVKDFDFNDPSRNQEERHRETELCAESGYINAGILLINLKAIRRDGMTANFLAEIKKGYLFQDQDVLNITCLSRIRHLPVKYNLMDYIFQHPDKDPYRVYSRDEFDEARRNPAIIHYAAHLKPWLYYGLKHDSVWQRYFSLSIYNSQSLKRKNCKFQVLQERIVSRIDHSIMLAGGFFRYWKTRGLLFSLGRLVIKTRRRSKA